tara:strand:- start:3038 stop:3394 length:357 start_codon:yes stop_codon:yes gene_type:complete
MKKLKVFKQVAEHLLDQNEKSEDKHGCYYLHPANGLKCALGCLIEDQYYTPEIEEKTLESSVVALAVANSLGSPITTSDREILDALQDLHDYKDAKDWKKELNILSMEFFDKPLEEIL